MFKLARVGSNDCLTLLQVWAWQRQCSWVIFFATLDDSAQLEAMDGFVQELSALGRVPRRDLIVALTMFAEDLSTDPAGVDGLVKTLCDAISLVRT